MHPEDWSGDKQGEAMLGVDEVARTGEARDRRMQREGDDAGLLCREGQCARLALGLGPRGGHLPVWMSLCRSKFPMLLKIRPQISHG